MKIKKKGPAKKVPHVPEISKIGTVTNQSVLKCTGKGWAQWIEVLDGFGAKNLTHKEIVAELGKKKYKLSIWWRQGVTSGYEIHIGRKLPGRNAKGLFSMTTVKTVPFPKGEVWDALSSKEGQEVWLQPLSPVEISPKSQFEVSGGIFGEIRTVKAPTRIRLSWQDSDWEKPTVLQILLVPRGKSKCMIVFQQEGVTTAAIKDALRIRWRRAIDDLETFLASKISLRSFGG